MIEPINKKENVINQTEEPCEMALCEKVGQLAAITELDEYTTKAQNVIPLILHDLQQVNSETRHLFGKLGDEKPWIISENKIVKLYKMVQKLVDLQDGEDLIRIKKKNLSDPLDPYMGILKLKQSLSTVQIFAHSYRRLLPMEDKYTGFRCDLAYIFNAATEIESDLVKSLDKIK